MKLILATIFLLNCSNLFAQTTELKKKKKDPPQRKNKQLSPVKISTPPQASAPKPEVKTETKKKTIKDHFAINYFGVLDGPSASQYSRLDFRSRRTDKDGDANQTKGGPYVQWDHQFSFLGKKMFGDLDFVANVRFQNTTNPSNRSVSRDLRVGVQGMVYQSKQAGFWARFDLDIPTSTGSKKDQLITSPGWLLDYFYAVNKSWTLGALHFLKIPFYEETTMPNGSDIDHVFQWFGPYATYRINDTFDFMTIYNLEYSNYMQNGNHFHFRNVWETLQVGFNIRVGGGWTIYPAFILDLYKNADTYNEHLIGVQFWLFGPVF